MFKFLRKTYLYILAIPIFLIILGASLNQAVMIANHGKFPVQLNSTAQEALGAKPGDVLDGRGHSVMAPEDHLKVLADILNFGNIYSIGDELIDLGSWGWTFAPYVWGFAVIKRLKD